MKNHSAALLLAISLVPFSIAQARDPAYLAGYHGYGPARIGMNLDELQAALGYRLVSGIGTEGCEHFWPPDESQGVIFMLIDGKLARVDVLAPGIKTFSGAQVGSTQASILAAYPRIQITPHHYAGPHGAYLTQYSADGRYGIRFETDNEKVDTYYVGTEEAVQYVEGCL